MVTSKKQWRNWSLPSKLTAIGSVLSAISLALYLIEKAVHVPLEPPKQVPDHNINITTGITNSGEMKIQGNVTIKSEEGGGE